MKVLDRVHAFCLLVAARLRAVALRLRGASIGAKVKVGPGLRARRPWCIRMGRRCEIEHGVFLKIVDDGALLELGEMVFVGTGSEFDVARSVRIGAHTLIAPNVFITDHTHNASASMLLNEQGTRSAAVAIGRDAWIGTRAVILAGVTVGDGAIVGAGAVVTRDVAAYTIVAGVPASVIGERRS